MPEEVDLVLAMTQQHAATLGRVFAGLSAKVHTLLGYAQAVTTMERIPDPYEPPIAVRRATVRQILYHLRLVVEGLSGAVGNAFARVGPGRAREVARLLRTSASLPRGRAGAPRRRR